MARPEAERDRDVEDEDELAAEPDPDVRFVTIRRVSSAFEADRLRALLEDEGIVATTQGAGHSALVGGLMDPILDLRVQVPERDAEHALELLAALEEPEEPAVEPPEEDDALRGDGPFRSGATTEPLVRPRKPIVAFTVAILGPAFAGIFGAGHFYARRPGRGLALLATAWFSIVAGFVTGRFALCAIAVLVAIVDALVSASVIRADARARESLRRS